MSFFKKNSHVSYFHHNEKQLKARQVKADIVADLLYAYDRTFNILITNCSIACKWPGNPLYFLFLGLKLLITAAVI